MTRLLATIITAVLLVASLSAAEGNFLNIAILNLPERYLADLPLKNRGSFLTRLSQQSSDPRLDYSHGWLHFYSDNPYEDDGATTSFYLKLLSREPKNSKPLIFVHMFRDAGNDTFILEEDANTWKDVTRKYIPKQIALTSFFTPRRTVPIIQVEASGKGKKTTPKNDTELLWNGESFSIRKVPHHEVPPEDNP